ncbi:MAG: KAP family NTPase [Corallococcus sp.]|nr:KAP family NTPase [Corallococcus sp.]
MNKPDTLNRQPFIEQIFNLIETISANKGNTTFAIDGEWGCGKSYVLDMLEEKLCEVQNPEIADNKYFVIKYNCWQYDFYEEPLIAFVSAIIDNLPHLIQNEKKRAGVLAALKTFAIGLFNIGNEVIKNKFGFDALSTIESLVTVTKNAKNDTQTKIQKEHGFDNYFDFKKRLSDLREILSNLSKEQTIIIIIDELDRCLPEYSIKVLERIHHITQDLPNTISIIATDKSKLENTVNKIYGYDKSINTTDINLNVASIYLKKFINFEIKLDNGTNDIVVLEKYKTFIEQFDSANINKEVLSEYISLLFNGIPVREQEHLWAQAELTHNLISTTKLDCTVLSTELLLVVYANYYGYKILDGITTTRLDNPLELRPRKNQLSKFEQNFIQERFHDVTSYNSVTVRNVYNLTGLYGIVLWYLNNIKVRTNPSFPSYIRLDNNLILYDTYLSNLNFVRKFAETLKLIK